MQVKGSKGRIRSPLTVELLERMGEWHSNERKLMGQRDLRGEFREPGAQRPEVEHAT